MRDIILQAIEKVFHGDSSYYFVPAETVEPKIIRNAIKSYAYLCSEKDAVALMDTSANHSGMSGCLLGVDALYDQLNHDPIPLAELEKAEIHESKGGYIRLTYKGGETLEAKCYQGQYICTVLNAIAEIAAAEREKNPQKPKRKVGKPLGKVKYSVEVFGFASGAVKRNRNKSGFAPAKYMTVSRSNAAKYIAPGMDEGDGRIIMDTTLTHSGKKGYLFSADALYSHQ